jgi:hypothetical protein
MLRSDHVPAAFLLDGYNCRRIWHDANMVGRFGDDLLDQRNDRAPNLRVFNSSVCLYQCHPIGRREKSTQVTRYRIATFREFREMKLARRPLEGADPWQSQLTADRLDRLAVDKKQTTDLRNRLHDQDSNLGSHEHGSQRGPVRRTRLHCYGSLAPSRRLRYPRVLVIFVAT